jgi:hypothetical protein
MMPVKPFVFRGEDGIDHMRWHFVESQLAAETLGDARFPQRNSIPIKERDALDGRAQERRRNRHKLQAEVRGDQQQRGRGEQRDYFPSHMTRQRGQLWGAQAGSLRSPSKTDAFTAMTAQ